MALSIQDASPIPHAREFSDLYEYKVAAREDQIEVWEDLADKEEHLAQIYANSARPFRVHKRFMKKGESVIAGGSYRLVSPVAGSKLISIPAPFRVNHTLRFESSLMS